MSYSIKKSDNQSCICTKK